jgi:SAM-dependent methyltransferase
MIRTGNVWQAYAEANINMSHGMQVRGYVAGDDLLNFVANGQFLVRRVLKETQLETLDGLRILDVGCGNGRFPIGTDSLGYEPEHYDGIDVVRNAIYFCKAAFSRYKGLRRYFFHHVPVHNSRYAMLQTRDAREVKFPGENYDLIVANSLFTHLGRPVTALHYLGKAAEALAPGGKIFATWFKSPPNRVSYNEKRTVYAVEVIYKMYDQAGLTIVDEFGGDTTSNKNQWRLIAVRKEHEEA